MITVNPEQLKLKICPKCAKTKGQIDFLVNPPVYGCPNCKIGWGEMGITDEQGRSLEIITANEREGNWSGDRSHLNRTNQKHGS